MAFALTALLLTGVQALLVFLSLSTPGWQFAHDLLIDGSPMHIAIRLLSFHAPVNQPGFVIAVLLGFHLIKYFCIYMARVDDHRVWPFYPALLLEIAYLVYCGMKAP